MKDKYKIINDFDKSFSKEILETLDGCDTIEEFISYVKALNDLRYERETDVDLDGKTIIIPKYLSRQIDVEKLSDVEFKIIKTDAPDVYSLNITDPSVLENFKLHKVYEDRILITKDVLLDLYKELPMLDYIYAACIGDSLLLTY